MTYKITTQTQIEVFTYQDADEEIPDYECHKSLVEMKENLSNIKFKQSSSQINV